MDSKAKFLLSLNLLFYVLFATTSGAGADLSSPPDLTPPSNGSSSTIAACPRDALKLGVCANLLGELAKVEAGNPPTTPCCSLLAGLVDLEVAACLCTVIKANVLGMNLNVPISLNLLLNVCGKTPPTDFICA